MKDAPPACEVQTSTEWLIDALGCDAESLCDLRLLQSLCDQIVADLGLRVLGQPQWHQFPSLMGEDQAGGITGMLLLSESHLTCHTFPEHRMATWNLYCCRPKPSWDWSAHLRSMLGAREVRIRSFGRGAALGALNDGAPA